MEGPKEVLVEPGSRIWKPLGLFVDGLGDIAHIPVTCGEVPSIGVAVFTNVPVEGTEIVRRSTAAWPQVAIPFRISGLALLFILPVLGCGDKGRVRVADDGLPGTYVGEFNPGIEQLVLRSDKSYSQIFSAPTRQFTNRGAWESTYQFLEGTEIGLKGANCGEERPQIVPECYRYLNVHREDGRLKLALNEAADWYYVRVETPKSEDILGKWVLMSGETSSSIGNEARSSIVFQSNGNAEAMNLPVSTLDDISKRWSAAAWTGTGRWSIGNDDGSPVVNVRTQNEPTTATQFVMVNAGGRRTLYYFHDEPSSKPRLELRAQ